MLVETIFFNSPAVSRAAPKLSAGELLLFDPSIDCVNRDACSLSRFGGGEPAFAIYLPCHRSPQSAFSVCIQKIVDKLNCT